MGVCRDRFCRNPTVCTLGADVSTIQAAVDNLSCDVLEIPASTHREHGVEVRRSFRIVGAGSGASTIDAEGKDRHFLVSKGVELRLSGLTLENGDTANTGTLPRRYQGGAIYAEVDVSLRLEDMIFKDNRAESYGGAIFVEPLGGGKLFCEECSFVDNEVTGASPTMRGGAIECSGEKEIELRECSFQRNRAIRGSGSSTDYFSLGGAAYLSGEVLIEGCSFIENNIDSSGWLQGGALATFGDVLLKDVSFEGNELMGNRSCSNCAGRGGAFHHGGGTLHLEGFSATGNVIEKGTDGSSQGGALAIFDTSSVTLKDGHIVENSVRGGESREGGGVYISASRSKDTTVSIERVSFEQNKADCFTSGCSGESLGGGLHVVTDTMRTEVSISQVAAASNMSDGTGRTSMGGFLSAVSTGTGDLRIRVENSTFSQNYATGAGDALALLLRELDGEYGRGVAGVFNGTFYRGRGPSLFHLHRDFSFDQHEATLQLRNSIIDRPGKGVCSTSSNGELISRGWLVHPSDMMCQFQAGSGDIIDDALNLEPLSNSGGRAPTRTHALPARSPILESGEPGQCTDGRNPIVVDQRGNRRSGAACTPGAWSP